MMGIGMTRDQLSRDAGRNRTRWASFSKSDARWVSALRHGGACGGLEWPGWGAHDAHPFGKDNRLPECRYRAPMSLLDCVHPAKEGKGIHNEHNQPSMVGAQSTPSNQPPGDPACHRRKSIWEIGLDSALFPRRGTARCHAERCHITRVFRRHQRPTANFRARGEKSGQSFYGFIGR